MEASNKETEVLGSREKSIPGIGVVQVKLGGPDLVEVV